MNRGSRSLSLSTLSLYPHCSIQKRLTSSYWITRLLASPTQGSKAMHENNTSNYGGRAEGRSKRSWVETLLRMLGLCLTLIAAIIVGVNKQTKIVAVTVIATLPPLNVPATAESKDLSAFVFFVVVNAVACTYAAISLLLSLIGKKKSHGIAIMVIMDMLMTALLFSSIGAAGAIGLMGYQGNSHVRWKKVCHVFDKFCNHVAVALALSFVGCLVFLLLVTRGVWRLHKTR